MKYLLLYISYYRYPNSFSELLTYLTKSIEIFTPSLLVVDDVSEIFTEPKNYYLLFSYCQYLNHILF